MTLKKQDIRILKKKISDEKKDAFFYKEGIAHGIKEDGTAIMLIIDGEILVKIDGKLYNNNTKEEAIFLYGLTDNKLKELEKEGRLRWENNAWFIIIWTRDGRKEWERVGDLVAFDYDDAMKMFTDYYNSGKDRGTILKI